MDPERNAEYLRLIRVGIEVVRIDKSVVRFSMDCDINDHATSLQSAVLKSGIILDYMNPSEYVDLCLRGDVLMEFLKNVDGEKYVCDCDFNHQCCIYICNNPKVCIEVVAKKPLYYYRYSMFRGVRHKYLEEANNLP
jgi:hypothetical protein